MSDMISDLPIYVCAPHHDEDLTQYIGYKIAEATGVNYANMVPVDNPILVVEIGGIWDRPAKGSREERREERSDDGERSSPVDMIIEDKTKTKPFLTLLTLFFGNSREIKDSDFKTEMSGKFDSNYVRVELSNKIRYNAQMSNMFIKIMIEIINELKSVL